MNRKPRLIHLIPITAASCGAVGDGTPALPIETGVSFTNLSRSAYVQFQVRVHETDGGASDDYHTTLLAPGVTIRRRFMDVVGEPCPESIDLRLFLFDRINADVPIGLDEDEAVTPTPSVAGEVLGVPACGPVVAETYTIVNWDAPPERARVKIAQATPVEALIRQSALFPNDDAVWEVNGVDPLLANVSPQALEPSDPIVGRTILAGGAPAEGVGVLLRSRFRVRANDNDPGNDPDAGFGEPIDVTVTDATGAFRFDRPPGAYQIEAFSDELLFRPPSVEIENPSGTLLIVAEPVAP